MVATVTVWLGYRPHCDLVKCSEIVGRYLVRTYGDRMKYGGVVLLLLSKSLPLNRQRRGSGQGRKHSVNGRYGRGLYDGRRHPLTEILYLFAAWRLSVVVTL